MTEPIRFYSTKGEYGCFSNFSRHPIYVCGTTYPTSEHYFQSRKFAKTDPEWAKKITEAKTPRLCAAMGRDRSHPIRADWDGDIANGIRSVKEDFMRIACFCKFEQNYNCQKVLLKTGNAHLIEETIDDYQWGEGTDKTGKNKLGLILMELRSIFAIEDNIQNMSERIILSPHEDRTLVRTHYPLEDYISAVISRLDDEETNLIMKNGMFYTFRQPIPSP